MVARIGALTPTNPAFSDTVERLTCDRGAGRGASAYRRTARMKSRTTTGTLLLAALRLLCVPTALWAVQSLPGDADCDGVLNRNADLAAVVGALFEGTTCSQADANGDGRVPSQHGPILIDHDGAGSADLV